MSRVDEVTIELPRGAFEALEEALPPQCRFTDGPAEEAFSMLLWTPGTRIRVVEKPE